MSVPVIWIGERRWGDPAGFAVERRVAAWAEAGADVLYLEPDPGPLAWPGIPDPPQNRDAAHLEIWRAFILSWVDQAMRSDGPVWVLPWARRLVTSDGSEWPDGAALVEGLAELCRQRPVVVAPRAGRWTGRSPALGAIHSAECLGVPPVATDAAVLHQVAPWSEPWTTVAILGDGSDTAWGQSIAAKLSAVGVDVWGMGEAAGWPAGTVFLPGGDPEAARVRRWSVAVLSPRLSALRPELPGRLWAIHPRLRLIGPKAPPQEAEGLCFSAATGLQYARALGVALWLHPRRPERTVPWEPRFQELAQGACSRCFA